MNSGGLQPVTTVHPVAAVQTPTIVTVYGEKADMRFLEFFAANIHNPDLLSGLGEEPCRQTSNTGQVIQRTIPVSLVEMLVPEAGEGRRSSRRDGPVSVAVHTSHCQKDSRIAGAQPAGCFQ